MNKPAEAPTLDPFRFCKLCGWDFIVDNARQVKTDRGTYRTEPRTAITLYRRPGSGPVRDNAGNYSAEAHAYIAMSKKAGVCCDVCETKRMLQSGQMQMAGTGAVALWRDAVWPEAKPPAPGARALIGEFVDRFVAQASTDTAKSKPYPRPPPADDAPPVDWTKIPRRDGESIEQWRDRVGAARAPRWTTDAASSAARFGETPDDFTPDGGTP